MQPIIENLGALHSALGTGFVLFCGSAVSGQLEPSYPMTDVFKKETLLAIRGKLQNGSYLDKTTALYAESLAVGHYGKLGLSDKFETFLWKLGRASDPVGVESLLRALYGSKTHRNPNHDAIEFLLEKKIAAMCLTTNFDRAIEFGTRLKVWCYGDKFDELPSSQVLKLHGDAYLGNSVATLPQLDEASLANYFDFLPGLLANKNVWVLGYSGTGDVDIAPHLEFSSARLFWGGRKPQESRRRTGVKLDLGCGPASSENLLLALAKSYGWQPRPTAFVAASWPDEIKSWVANVPCDSLRRFIISLLSWNTDWPHLHLANIAYWTRRSIHNQLDLGRAAAQASCYRTCIKWAVRTQQCTAATGPDRFEAAKLIIFSLWRIGRLREAIEKCRKLILSADSSNDQILEHLNEAVRHYLEISLEVISHTRDPVERRLLAEDADLARAISLLPKRAVQLLEAIATLELEFHKRAKSEQEVCAQARELYRRCEGFENWVAAGVLAQFLMQLTSDEGQALCRNVLDKTKVHLKARRDAKLLSKIQAREWHVAGWPAKYSVLVRVSMIRITRELHRILKTVKWRALYWCGEPQIERDVNVGLISLMFLGEFSADRINYGNEDRCKII